MATLAQFGDNIRRVANNVDRNVPILLRKAAIAALQTVVMATPVGNPTLWNGPHPKGYVGGRARANWLVGVGEVRTDTVEVGHDAIAEGASAIESVNVSQPIHITNNLPYITPLNEGHSHQAPAGFVEAAVAAASAAINGTKLTD